MRKMQRRLQEKVDEPQLKAMFETAAELRGGLKKAFSNHQRKEREGLAVQLFRKKNPQSPARRFEQLDGIAGRIVE
jgi:hypothetical protein